MKDKLQEVMQRVADYNTMDKTLLKVIEECAELTEVVTKTLTKKEEYRPPMSKISEEMGDVLFRVLVAAKKLGIEEDVKTRIAAKSKQLDEWITAEMYKGGV